MRRHRGPLAVSPVVLLEARNLFSRITGEALPLEWQTLEADLGGRLHVEAANWESLRRECEVLLAKYAWKAALGTLETAIVASAKLAGVTRFLSFDANAGAGERGRDGRVSRADASRAQAAGAVEAVNDPKLIHADGGVAPQTQ